MSSAPPLPQGHIPTPPPATRNPPPATSAVSRSNLQSSCIVDAKKVSVCRRAQSGRVCVNCGLNVKSGCFHPSVAARCAVQRWQSEQRGSRPAAFISRAPPASGDHSDSLASPSCSATTPGLGTTRHRCPVHHLIIRLF